MAKKGCETEAAHCEVESWKSVVSVSFSFTRMVERESLFPSEATWMDGPVAEMPVAIESSGSSSSSSASSDTEEDGPDKERDPRPWEAP